jgi:hypothetical protein
MNDPRVPPVDGPVDGLRSAVLKQLEALEAALPDELAALIAVYNRAGADLNLVCASLNTDDPGDELKVLQAMREAYEQRGTHKRRYVRPAGSEPSPSDHVVSSAEVTELGAHELVRIWSRGGLAGELVVSRGDGARLCCVLMMLEPEQAP